MVTRRETGRSEDGVEAALSIYDDNTAYLRAVNITGNVVEERKARYHSQSRKYLGAVVLTIVSSADIFALEGKGLESILVGVLGFGAAALCVASAVRDNIDLNRDYRELIKRAREHYNVHRAYR